MISSEKQFMFCVPGVVWETQDYFRWSKEQIG